ncbi:MAG: non-heme iron oxygenase ferredoxin subunit [Candidatus Caldarchaeum sp.]
MGRIVEIAKRGDLQPGEVIGCEVEGHQIALFNIEGEYFAIEDRCTHRDAQLSMGEVVGEVVICPFHAAEFNIKTGNALSQPATEPVRTYKVRVEGESIMVELD